MLHVSYRTSRRASLNHEISPNQATFYTERKRHLAFAVKQLERTMRPSTVFVVVVLCAVCGGVSAIDMSKLQPYNITAAIMFIQEDKNGDGQMTTAEIDTVFNQYDTNGDGRESRHEYTQMICASDPDLYQISHYLFDDYDVNGDHHLEITDYEGWLKKMDTDGDNLVSQDEFVAHWVKLFESIEGQAAQHPHGNSHEHGHCN